MAVAPNLLTSSTIRNKTTGIDTVIPVVSVPAISVTILTTLGKTFYINTITACSSLNQIGYNVTGGQLTFTIEPDPNGNILITPEIGPMDEIYIYQHNFDLQAYTPEKNDQDIEFRTFTGLIDSVHSIFDPKLGIIYNITFSTNMKKFAVTNEYKPIDGIDDSSIPSLFTPSYEYPIPGIFVQIACQQSNVAPAYIFLAAGPDGTAQNAFIENNNVISQQSNDVIVDKYGVQTFNGHFPLKSILPFVRQFAFYEYQKWSAILTQILDQSFCEGFFNKYGYFYYRQLGMFRAAQDFDIEIDDDIVRSYDIFEDDSPIITRLELRWYNITNSSTQVFNVWVPPNLDVLERRYGPRYELKQVSWTTLALAKINDLQGTNVSSQTLDNYLQDYATFTLALSNASAIRGQVQIVGNNAFEIGQTVYLKKLNKIFYVTGVQHLFRIGDGWWTTLQLNFGRDASVDFLKYTSALSTLLGPSPVTNFSGDTTVQKAFNLVTPGLPVVNSGTPSGALDQNTPTLDAGLRGNPFFGSPMVVVTNGYGASPNAASNALNSSDGLHHTGVDLSPSLNGGCGINPEQRIVATADGVVKMFGAGDNSGWGNFVILSINDAPGLYVEYSHMKNLAFNNLIIGDPIKRGTIIGEMDSTGNAHGTHLHLQVQNTSNFPDWVFSNTINPAKVLDISIPACSPYVLDSAQAIAGPPEIAPGFVPTGLHYSAQGTSENNPQYPTAIFWPIYNDNNYTKDVKAWAQGVASQVCGNSIENQLFFEALSRKEVGNSNSTGNNDTRFLGFFNFANIGAVNNNMALAHSFFKLEDGVNDTVSFLQGASYADFLNYMKNWPSLPSNSGVIIGNQLSKFNPNTAAELLGPGHGGWWTDPNGAALLANVYKDLVDKLNNGQ